MSLDWRQRRAGQFYFCELVLLEKLVSALILASSPSGAHKRGEGRFINIIFVAYDLVFVLYIYILVF